MSGQKSQDRIETWFVRATQHQNVSSFLHRDSSSGALAGSTEKESSPNNLYSTSLMPPDPTRRPSTWKTADEASHSTDGPAPRTASMSVGQSMKIFDAPRVPKPEKKLSIHKFLGYAAENEFEKISMYVFRGMDLNVADMFGWTALMCGAHRGHYQIVSYLIQAGADRTVRNKANQSASDLARSSGFFDVVSFLEEIDNYELVDRTVPEDSNSDAQVLSPFFCDICTMMFHETTQEEHQTSTLHLLSSAHPPSRPVFGLSERNIGFRLLQKAGWDQERGLGANEEGRLYPVATVFKQDRKGLGAGRYIAKVTHYPHLEKQAPNTPVSKSSTRKEIMQDFALKKHKEVRLRRSLHGL